MLLTMKGGELSVAKSDVSSIDALVHGNRFITDLRLKPAGAKAVERPIPTNVSQVRSVSPVKQKPVPWLLKSKLWMRDWAVVLAVGVALLSCAMQLYRWQTTITGVAFTWPAVGLTSALIKVMLLGGAVLSITALPEEHLRSGVQKIRSARWGRNMGLAITLMCTNLILGVTLINRGVNPLQDENSLWLLVIWGATGVSLAWKWRKETPEQRLLRFGTGFTIVPVIVQGKDYLIHGPGGMPWVNMILLISLVAAMAYIAPGPGDEGLSGHKRRQAIRDGKYTLYQFVRRDFFFQTVFLAVPFIIGGILHRML